MSDLRPVVKAGNLLESRCPEGQNVLFKVGDLVKKDDQILFSVVRVDKNTVFLGPYKEGVFEIDIPCEGGESVQQEVEVLAVNPLEKPERQDLIPPFELSWGLYIALFLGALGLFLTSILAVIIVKVRNKKRKALLEENKKKKHVSIDAELEAFLNVAPGLYLGDCSPQKISEFYQNCYRLHRKSIEKLFDLKTQMETSREFIATLKVLAKPKKIDPQIIQRAESLLLSADHIRFTRSQPAKNERKEYMNSFQEQAQTILKAFKLKAQRMAKEAP